LKRYRGKDSDESDDSTNAIPQPLTTGEALAACLADLRWEFAEPNVGSDDEEGEEPEFVNSIDFNLYLIRRLHDLPNRSHLNLSEIETRATEFGERIFVVREKVALRRSKRLEEKRRGASAVSEPLMRGESSDEEDATTVELDNDADATKLDQTTS
jgi:hypothetical protein